MYRTKRIKQFVLIWIKDIFRSRAVAVQLFKKQLANQYRHSWLGIGWAILPSALTAIVLMASQNTHIADGTALVPAAFYGVFGLSMAQSFLESLNSARLLFTLNQQLFQRYNVPIDGFAMASILEVTMNALFRILVLGLAFSVFRVQPNTRMLPLAFIGFISINIFGFGLGLVFAPLNSLKRDFDNFFAFAPWLVFALTPVFLPFSPDSVFGKMSVLNPVAILFEATRGAAYHGGHTSPINLISWLVYSLIILLFGWSFCRIAKPYVIERTI